MDHFENLTRAHAAVVQARRQLELLTPLVADLDAYDQTTETMAKLTARQALLGLFFAERAQEIFGSQLRALSTEIDRVDTDIETVGRQLTDFRDDEHRLKAEIAGHGGDRLAVIAAEIERLHKEQPARRNRLREFNQLLNGAGLEAVTSATQFSATRDQVAARDTELRQQQDEAQTQLTAAHVELQKVEADGRSVNDELRSLQTRRTNLPAVSLELRAALCADLRLDPDDLPFAGELIQVRPESADWEGAAERVLHNFALSLLVPNVSYEQVSSWINERHLAARLVYYRVPPTSVAAPAPNRPGGLPLLLDHLEIKPDTPLRAWLQSELGRRANHACVDTMAEFRSSAKALTRAGQIKDRERHEKDDRSRIDDRRRYVLGWTNEAKIEALIDHAAELQRRISGAEMLRKLREKETAAVAESLRALAGLAGYSTWEELDWEKLVNEVAALEDERRRILAASDRLSALNAELDRVVAAIAEHDRRRNGLLTDRGALDNQRQAAQRELRRAETTLATNADRALPESERDAVGGLLAAHGEGPLTDGTGLVRAEQAVREVIARQQQKLQESQNRLRVRTVKAMTEFRHRYPAETAEMDDSVEAGGDYRELHRRVADDDLPRFEREFKDYLNQNTIRDIAGFSAKLHAQERDIRERIETINASLEGIDYNDGRYIRLIAGSSPNTDVRQFRADLRACTDNIVSTDRSDQYSEQKFLQVKALIDRFRGREGLADADRNWTHRVTDVRQWFVFSASERWRDDDCEYEHYSDSAGKSGGQKEKLAYTILAASLAYQFKLDWGSGKSKAFRFVVIDEAFSRGSEASTRYALSLFTRLGLQLLIVTPLQKIRVIEPHVSSVGFVDNPNGSYSRLQSLSITEFRQRLNSTGPGVAAAAPGPAA